MDSVLEQPSVHRWMSVTGQPLQLDLHEGFLGLNPPRVDEMVIDSRL